MISPQASIHPLAQISPDAIIEQGVRIGPGVIIEAGVKVESYANVGYGHSDETSSSTHLKAGSMVATNSVIYHSVVLEENVKIRHNVVVRECVRIGKGTSIGSMSTIEHHCSIGFDCSLHSRIHLTDYSLVGDHVFIGPGFVSMSDPVMSYRRPAIQVPFKGVEIMSKARIGGGVLALPGTIVGEEAFIGAGSLIKGHVKGGYIYIGNPARPVRRLRESEFYQKTV